MTTPKESKRIGGSEAIKSSVTIYILFEMVLLYFETRGDFANGILFFISNQTNLVVIAHYLLYFCIMYFMGRQVGKAVLTEQKLYYGVALVSGLLATLVMVLASSLLLLLFKNRTVFFNNSEILSFAIKNFVLLVLPMLLVWFWITYKVKGTKFSS